jgi:hypothetical protein
MTRTHCWMLGVACAWLTGGAAAAWAADELAKQASWSAPTAADCRKQIDDLLSKAKADDALKLKVDALLPAGATISGGELLERGAAALAAIFPEAAPLAQQCETAFAGGKLPDPPVWLTDESTPALVRHNFRLLYGRWLAQNALFDDAAAQLTGLKPQAVFDPATLLFHQALAHHRLLQKNECLQAVSLLLENESQAPRRYITLAKLMEADIKPLKVDSLDEIARLMEDIQRRLNFAHAGKKVRDEEEAVIAKLDKMIEELEKQQQQQQQQQQSGSGGGSRPSSPMQESQAGQLKGPGQVDPKNVGKKDGWGNLPPKDRQEVMQQIGRELPAHFRETIEEYFKRLAQDGVK